MLHKLEVEEKKADCSVVWATCSMETVVNSTIHQLCKSDIPWGVAFFISFGVGTLGVYPNAICAE
jgi:hypothetical protein